MQLSLQLPVRFFFKVIFVIFAFSAHPTTNVAKLTRGEIDRVGEEICDVLI